MIALRTACVLAILALTAGPATAFDYKVRDLLEPCVEGDNDARDGAVLEMECEQYVGGFTDLYLHAGLAERDGVCLPAEGNRADEVRWAFMRWAHENFNERDNPAVEGLLATVRGKFKCR